MPSLEARKVVVMEIILALAVERPGTTEDTVLREVQGLEVQPIEESLQTGSREVHLLIPNSTVLCTKERRKNSVHHSRACRSRSSHLEIGLNF